MEKMSFGKWLKKKRKDRGYTQKYVAQRVEEITNGAVKCTDSNISGLEREYDKRVNGAPVTPRPELVDALADVFGVPRSEAWDKIRPEGSQEPITSSASKLAA